MFPYVGPRYALAPSIYCLCKLVLGPILEPSIAKCISPGNAPELVAHASDDFTLACLR